ncbi:3-hydroxyacyl-CoA dehydrogenase [Solimonas sp. K1W22B-7]|uniref:3-hydroxyacyl-CoA dehydrogenase NAD-binding domain-containing protein n=1 Tax=Solimonas sp. K1W22B-7 TaxID=2303331 RepID=UPI000E32FAB7|nr:3-hydroxyacyl-CoA dehydrogenase NAD-binding domain-containing protein [Solimonas sp. K1W22B-7]AXQ28162.1 3-hydroxyacyl-CoA dehydrogenase [Solimonas sp. K1W22B-7]
MSVCDYRSDGDIAVISMNSPPVNGLGLPLREGIAAGLQQAAQDPAIKAIVLTGTPKAFSGGADIREFNSPLMLATPNLHDILVRLEAMEKPVVAAISGVCLGGGLELALGCHYRVALADAQIALPEVKLGLLPGGGGTQRLPRLVGVQTALEMVVGGDMVPADKLAGTALFDEMISGDLLAGALAFARKLAAARPLPRVRDREISQPDAAAFFAAARAQVARQAGRLPAPLKCLECIEAAATKSFDEGMEVERKGFEFLLNGPESRALRHAFFGERAAAKIPDIPDSTPLRPIDSAAVIGAGTMGGGIAMNFANVGIPVRILEMKQEALDRGLGVIRKNYENQVRKGKLTQEKLDQRMALIQPTLDYADLAQADIVIEAVFEDMNVKQAVFEKLDAVMKPGAILASNTSTLDLDRIALFTRRPQDVVGLHFFSPANVMRLLEVVRGKQTAKDVMATVMQLGRRIRKLPVVAGVCDGFVGNRMINKYSAEAMVLLEEGALPQQVDGAVEQLGFAMGPFRMSDLAGNDVGWYIRKRHYAEHPDMRPSLIADRVCELGRYGQKTGKGWYAYQPGDRNAHPDPEVEQIILGVSQELGVQRRAIPDSEIVERLVYALVNEGARIVEEGIALRASDIDMMYLNGYGFPLHLGGPMLYADLQGLDQVAARCREFAKNPLSAPGFWEPAALLAKLAAAGKTFN